MLTLLNATQDEELKERGRYLAKRAPLRVLSRCLVCEARPVVHEDGVDLLEGYWGLSVPNKEAPVQQLVFYYVCERHGNLLYTPDILDDLLDREMLKRPHNIEIVDMGEDLDKD